MKKLALAFVAAICLVGLTGCGGGESTVVAPAEDAPEVSADEQAQMDAEMEAAMSQQGP